MPVRKETLGIKVTFTPYEFPNSFDAIFTAGFGKPSQTFITNPIIQRTIREAQLEAKKGERIGYITTRYYPELCAAQSYFYYPISDGENKPIAGFKNKGIARRLEQSVVNELRRRYPKVKTMHFFAPSEDLLAKLIKMGFSRKQIRRGVKFNEYLSALRNYRKARPIPGKDKPKTREIKSNT